MCPPGYYQSANGLMVTHALGHMIYIWAHDMYIYIYIYLYMLYYLFGRFFLFCYVSVFLRKQPPEVFCKKDVIKKFTKFTGKHLLQSLSTF